MRILVVEDEPKLLKSILEFLKTEDYICDGALSYREATDHVSTYNYDCLIVDITLGDGSGLELIKILKLYKSEAGIIIISAKDSLEDKIHGLELGSDDYLTKPFHLSELNARLRAVLRRKNYHGQENLKFGEIRIELSRKAVYLKETEVYFTPKEYELLLFFIANQNKVVTKTSIADHMWEDEYSFGSYDFIYSHIKNLRKKFEDSACPDYLKTIYGIGYKFELA